MVGRGYTRTVPETPIGPYPRLPLQVRPPDPGAVVVARAVAGLVAARRPDLVVEHLGSSAVPGLPGKGVVDLGIHPIGPEPGAGHHRDPARPRLPAAGQRERLPGHPTAGPRWAGAGRRRRAAAPDPPARDPGRCRVEPPDRVPRRAPGRSSAGRRVHRAEARDRGCRDHERPALLDGQDGVHPTRPGRARCRRGADPARLDDRHPRRRPARPDAGCGPRALGYRVAVLDPDPDCPAAADRRSTVVAAYDDAGAALALADGCAVVTYELEHVSAPSPMRSRNACRSARARSRSRRPSTAWPSASSSNRSVRRRRPGARFARSTTCATARRRSASRSASRRRSVATTDGARSGSPSRRTRSTRPGAPGNDAERSGLLLESELEFELEFSIVVGRDLAGRAAPFPPPATGTMPAS